VHCWPRCTAVLEGARKICSTRLTRSAAIPAYSRSNLST
jgi:hypothetical protein